jgi:hypothetical protein
MLNATDSYFRFEMKVARLDSQAQTRYRMEWTTESVRTLSLEKKISAQPGIEPQAPGRLAHIPITTAN